MSGPAAADTGTELVLGAGTDVPIVAVGGIGFLLGTFFQSSLAPSSCRWCDGDTARTSTLNGLDALMRGLRWSDTATANTLSHVSAFAVAPAAAFGLTALAAAADGRMGGWSRDAFIIAESTLIAADLNLVAKVAVGRQRPAVHFAAAPGPGSSEDNLSFYSGDTTVAFSLAVSAGTVASMRGYRYAPLVWAVGLGFAATTGYLRMAADRHYFTDVATGALMGSLVGVAVPYFLHRKQSAIGIENQGGPVFTYKGQF